MSDPLVLKKYSNRRLYDTRHSQYVTLEDVAAMVRAGEQVRIQEATSGEDVTAFILTQIVLEAAKRRNSLLPVSVLHLIIRYGDNALNDFFEKYFHKILFNYVETKNAFDQQFGKWLDMGMDMTQRMPNVMPGAPFLEEMMELFGFSRPTGKQPKKAASDAAAPGDDESDAK
jgi:polyhydroxyalkanoate synthesis repressor PhaR